MRLDHRARRLALVGATALALTGAGAATAHAVEITGTNQSITTSYGVVKFDHTGESLYAQDTRSDGYDVHAQIRWGGELRVNVATTQGNGDWIREYFNAPEGENVVIRQCAEKNGTLSPCSGWQSAVA